MARDVIGKVPVVWSPAAGWQVPPESRFQADQLAGGLRGLGASEDAPAALLVTVERRRPGRSLAQNRLLWALLGKLADAQNGGRPGGVSPEDCYLQMLEQYGAKVDWLQVPVPAVPLLYRAYRVVRVVELLGDNRCTVKCCQGSSGYTTAQMHDLIEGIFDELAELGVSDPEVTQYWREFNQNVLP